MWSSKYDKPIDPPVGWTWEQVARKRALNLSHGAPSPREIAARSWRIGDTDTIPDDWQIAADTLEGQRYNQHALERLVTLIAADRERTEASLRSDPRPPEDILAHNRTLLHGDGDDVDP
jgi:hypothetical protein